MRGIFLLALIIPALLIAGCTQSNSSPVTPAITQSVDVITVPTTPSAYVLTTVPVIADGQMQINVTTWQRNHDVLVQYNGGADAAELTALDITINNYNGQKVSRVMESPQPGDVYTFTYMGTPDPDNIDVIGVFTGGVEQTVLLTNV
ncbi:MAG TPA: hypothetical protein PKM50_05700 [Methanoregula sp.]|nr:hypothetical protein [Methanoregula sp.]